MPIAATSPCRTRGDQTHQVRVARLVHVAAPLLLRVNDSIGWPLDLHVHHQGRMQIIESTCTISPFGFNYPYRPELELNIFAAASGLCYLSMLSDERVAKLIDALRDQELWALARYRISPQRLFDELAAVRQNGYARRLVNQTDQTGFHAIAAPILGETRLRRGQHPLATQLSFHRQVRRKACGRTYKPRKGNLGELRLRQTRGGELCSRRDQTPFSSASRCGPHRGCESRPVRGEGLIECLSSDRLFVCPSGLFIARAHWLQLWRVLLSEKYTQDDIETDCRKFRFPALENRKPEAR